MRLTCLLFLLIGQISTVAADSVEVAGFKVHIYAPNSTGSLPVIFFVSGFDGLAPIFAYSDFLQRLVARSYIVVGLDHIAAPNYPRDGHAMQKVLEWAQGGALLAEMQKQGMHVVPDVQHQSVLMGQSEGNHVIGQALAYSCSVAKAAVLIDPVDGYDPYRFVKTEDLIKVGEKLNFTTPTLFLDNGLDMTHNFLSPACMPPAMGTSRWINAWRGPFWRINATAYGHIDCINSGELIAGKLVCPSNSRTDKDAYKAFLAQAIDLFLSGLFKGNAGGFAKLEDPKQFSVDVLTNSDLKGLSHKDIVPGCVNTAVQALVSV